MAPEDGKGAPGPDAIRQQLERILASPQFATAPSMGKMLHFVVGHALDGTADRLKEYTLGVEVFGRGSDFDPRQDTIVRVQGRRLRDRLDDYYREQGPADQVGIGLPKGHYVPAFHWRELPPALPSVPVASGNSDDPVIPDPPQTQPAKPRPRLMLALVLVAVASLAFAATIWLRKDAATPPPPDNATTAERPSLAVLPFADLSQARDQEYLADGLAEEILNQLAQVPALRLVGRTSSFSFKGRNEDLRGIGRKLGVGHLLEGSVRKSGDQLRVTAQLVSAADGSHLWSKTYARQMRDVFAVQDEIARDVATALSVKLDVVAFNREQGGTTNVDAYDRYLRWRNMEARELYGPEHLRERLRLAREMVHLDPQFLLGWDKLAASLESAYRIGGEKDEQLRAEMEQARARIAGIAPDSWLARRDRANALWREGKRVEAIALMKQVMDSGPLSRERFWDYNYMIFAMGQLDELIAIDERLRVADPLSLDVSRSIHYDYIATRRYQEAEAEYQRGLALEGNQSDTTFAAFICQLAGKRPGGIEELRGLYRRLWQFSSVDAPPAFHDLGKALDDRAAMLAIARKALADPAYGGSPYTWAHVASALGDADLSVAALRRGIESREGFREGTMHQGAYAALWILPYSNVRAHPDFKKLLIETGVVDYWWKTGKWGYGCKPVGKEDFQCS